MDENLGALRHSFTIPPDHPAFPGHFPGNNIVPGVVILSHVISVLEGAGARPEQLRRLKTVKFNSPLLPGEDALVTFGREGKNLTFAVTRDGHAIAKGTFATDTVSSP